MAYQALEGILKLEKVPSNKVPLSTVVKVTPGIFFELYFPKFYKTNY